MPNKYYEPGHERASRVSDLFARIAHRYDLINDAQSCFMHRWWKRRLVQLAGPLSGARALDLCCGTGDISRRLADDGAWVTGLDFSLPMLAVARQRTSTAWPGREERLFQDGPNRDVPVFLQADAQCIPFPDASFDVVSVAYGLRNLSCWEKGLEEMWRVAKPGARILVLDFGKPQNPAWRWCYFTYLRCFVPLLGLAFAGDAQAYAYILESLKYFPAQRGVAHKLERLAGCPDSVEVHEFLGGAMSIVLGRKPPS